MSRVFFISDLHIGHRAILKYSSAYRYGDNVDEHDLWLVTQWNSVVKSKKDIVYVLGDICFDKKKLWILDKMEGIKYMLPGNHDLFDYELYRSYFEKIIGFKKYREFWLSHAPIHPQELRGRKNIHGHVHANSIPDDRYINVSVEALNGTPITLEELRETK